MIDEELGMDHRFAPTSDKIVDGPHPKVVIEIQFPYEGGVTHGDLDEALSETSFVVLAAFEDGKLDKGEVVDSLGNPFLSWRLEEPGKIGETPTIEGARLVLKREDITLDRGILCIKALRNQWPDLGLKGAKDLYDSLKGESASSQPGYYIPRGEDEEPEECFHKGREHCQVEIHVDGAGYSRGMCKECSTMRCDLPTEEGPLP